MASRKTLPTTATVESYLVGIESDVRRADCHALVALMARVTKQPAVMWGPAIVGFGVRRYPLAGGKQGEICAVGFSSRKGDISIYALSGNDADESFLSKLGRHKRSKGCLYIRQLADVNMTALEELVALAYASRLPGHSMTRRRISSGSPFEEQIGYSRAVVHGDWIYVSGTTGFNYATMTIPDGVEAQARQCLVNIEAALVQAGASLKDVVRVHYILPDREDFPKCWPVLREYFGDVKPAATMLVAGLMDPRMRVEIEVTAVRGG